MSEETKDTEAPQVYTRRWFMLLMFCCCTCINGLGWINFVPIFSLLQEVYGQSLFNVNYLAMCYMVLFLPVNFPSVIALDKYGLKTGVLIGISFTTAGLCMRIFINESFTWVMVGQTLMAIG